jgi:hypothetical protein
VFLFFLLGVFFLRRGLPDRRYKPAYVGRDFRDALPGLASAISFGIGPMLIVEDHLGRMVRDVGALLLTLAVFVPVRTDGQGSTVLVVTGRSMPEPLY